jgi:hypothetical protein
VPKVQAHGVATITKREDDGRIDGRLPAQNPHKAGSETVRGIWQQSRALSGRGGRARQLEPSIVHQEAG